MATAHDIEAILSEVRAARRQATLATAIAIATVVASCSVARANGDVLSVRQLVVVDEAGRVVAELGAAPQGGGQLVISGASAADKTVVWSPGLAVYTSGKPSISLTAGRDTKSGVDLQKLIFMGPGKVPLVNLTGMSSPEPAGALLMSHGTDAEPTVWLTTMPPMLMIADAELGVHEVIPK